MSVQQMKAAFREVIDRHAEVDPHELRRVFFEAMREFETDRGWSESRKGKSWADNELRVVLSDAPTKENCLKHAQAFQRGYGSIEQIYRWAATDTKTIKQQGRDEDAFVDQIKRVARELGWRA